MCISRQASGTYLEFKINTVISGNKSRSSFRYVLYEVLFVQALFSTSLPKNYTKNFTLQNRQNQGRQVCLKDLSIPHNKFSHVARYTDIYYLCTYLGIYGLILLKYIRIYTFYVCRSGNTVLQSAMLRYLELGELENRDT